MTSRRRARRCNRQMSVLTRATWSRSCSKTRPANWPTWPTSCRIPGSTYWPCTSPVSPATWLSWPSLPRIRRRPRKSWNEATGREPGPRRACRRFMTPLQNYTAAHRSLLDMVARATGIADPIAFTASHLEWLLLKAARKKNAVAVDGVLVRDWSAANRKVYPGLRLGIRLYEIDHITFAIVQFGFDFNSDNSTLSFAAVDRSQYCRLYRIALRLAKGAQTDSGAPLLPAAQAANLWQNTIGFLEGDRLERIKAYGGRARRGVLLTGAPGNGKTMACRWLWEECNRRNWEYRIVTPNTYRQARRGCDPESAVRRLFSVQRRGVIFFDDMDLALRDRDCVNETEDQAVFLTALDGIEMKDGVVFVFTTNCRLDLIDRAFKRPGRIDVALHFEPPDAKLRRRLLAPWHADIVAQLDTDDAVADTDGFSFAEIEELRNLLIMHHADTGQWRWNWALAQFAENREDLRSQLRRSMGFSLPDAEVAVGVDADE